MALALERAARQNPRAEQWALVRREQFRDPRFPKDRGGRPRLSERGR
jgi:hypothetical protein